MSYLSAGVISARFHQYRGQQTLKLQKSKSIVLRDFPEMISQSAERSDVLVHDSEYRSRKSELNMERADPINAKIEAPIFDCQPK